MKKFKHIFLITLSITFFSSCSTTKVTMKGVTPIIELKSSDFDISKQLSAEASETKIIGIDFKRLFSSKAASIDGEAISAASIPVVGSYLSSFAKDYALYNLMEANKGYDVVLYPQFYTKRSCPFLGICLLTDITKVTVTARLGKIK